MDFCELIISVMLFLNDEKYLDFLNDINIHLCKLLPWLINVYFLSMYEWWFIDESFFPLIIVCNSYVMYLSYMTEL